MTVNAITAFFVEDSAEDRALYRRFLERDDRYTYNIYEFESGNKALQECLGTIPDVILLDYRLPDLDGLEFISKLQRQISSSQISVIMLTGQGDETIAVQAIKSGADDYLVKGKLTQENFCRTIHGAIKHKQLMQQLERQQEQQNLVEAIAIQQAQLYDNLQTLNTKLEAKVQERTIKLQESDRRFRAIFNNTFQFTGLLTPFGILLEANQTALSFGGLQMEDVINRPFWEAHLNYN